MVEFRTTVKGKSMDTDLVTVEHFKDLEEKLEADINYVVQVFDSST